MNKKCLGCGVTLQNTNEEAPGYTKSLDMDYCMRCFRLIHYREFLKLPVSYDETKILNCIEKKKGFVFYFVDFLNICKETLDHYHRIKAPKMLVISKSDIIPKSIYLKKVKDWLQQEFGVKEQILFINQTSKQSKKKILEIMENREEKRFYFLGITNAGKSTFLNGLLDMLEEENRHIAVSEMPDTTLDFIEIKLSIGTIYDSQGFSYHYLDTEDALIRVANNKIEIKPVTYQMKENESLILENLIRINSNKKNSITFFGSANLKLQKVYENNIRLKNSYKIVLDVPNNSQLVLKGIGFFYIKQACELTIYGLEKYALEVIPSFMGAKL